MFQVGADKQGLDRFQYLLAHNSDGWSHLCRVDLLNANQITCLAVKQKKNGPRKILDELQWLLLLVVTFDR